MNQVGKRIIYNTTTGNVLNDSLNEIESSNDLTELRPDAIGFIDLPYGDTTLNDATAYHVDVLNKKIVIDATATSEPNLQELQQKILSLQGVI